jgi:2-iminobutanoate/2-iminopropanoate deaminase
MKIIDTILAPKAVGTYSQGVLHNGVYYFSGQIGLDPETMTLREGFQAQLNQVLKNIDGLLESQNLTRKNIIKTSIFMTDLAQFSEVNKAYEEYFTVPYPLEVVFKFQHFQRERLLKLRSLQLNDWKKLYF